MQQHLANSDIYDDFLPFFDYLLAQIETSDNEKLVQKVIETGGDTKLFKKNEFAAKLYKYIMVNYFILLFAGMDEYRIAKYIVFSNDNRKENSRFESHIKGTFFYEWILELSKIFRSDDSRTFIVGYAKIFTNFIEPRLNRNDVGVIGGPTKPSNPTLERISNFFTEFLSLSPYSKISIVNDLQECPLKEMCDLDGEGMCGLYDHGQKRFSKFDLT
jgi:hypothetical protein